MCVRLWVGGWVGTLRELGSDAARKPCQKRRPAAPPPLIQVPYNLGKAADRWNAPAVGTSHRWLLSASRGASLQGGWAEDGRVKGGRGLAHPPTAGGVCLPAGARPCRGVGSGGWKTGGRGVVGHYSCGGSG